MHCWYVCWSSAVSQCTGRNLNSELMSSYIELSIRSSRVNSKLHGLLRWGVLLLKIFIERLNKDINCTYVLLGHWEFHYFKILFNNTYFRIFMWIILYIQNLYITLDFVIWTKSSWIFVRILHGIRWGVLMKKLFLLYFLCGKNRSRPAFKDMEWKAVL